METKCGIFQVGSPARVTEIFQEYFGENNGVELRLEQHRPHEPITIIFDTHQTES